MALPGPPGGGIATLVTIRSLPPALLPGAVENHPQNKVRASMRGFIQGTFDPEVLWWCELPSLRWNW